MKAPVAFRIRGLCYLNFEPGQFEFPDGCLRLFVSPITPPSSPWEEGNWFPLPVCTARFTGRHILNLDF